jgi:hypothetical protein
VASCPSHEGSEWSEFAVCIAGDPANSFSCAMETGFCWLDGDALGKSHLWSRPVAGVAMVRPAELVGFCMSAFRRGRWKREWRDFPQWADFRRTIAHMQKGPPARGGPLPVAPSLECRDC